MNEWTATAKSKLTGSLTHLISRRAAAAAFRCLFLACHMPLRSSAWLRVAVTIHSWDDLFFVSKQQRSSGCVLSIQ